MPTQHRRRRRTPIAGAKEMTVWFDFFSTIPATGNWNRTSTWTAAARVALEDTEYIVYMEKPGPLEVTVEKHGYDIYWINPATGESTKDKKFSGEHFTVEPPDKSHDWVLHVVREGRVEGMNKSYKFESREIVLQEVESNSAQGAVRHRSAEGDLSVSKPPPYRRQDHAGNARHAVA